MNILICSPLTGNVLERVASVCAWLSKIEKLHPENTYYTGVLCPAFIVLHREQHTEMMLKIVGGRHIDQVWLYGNTITGNMQRIINFAEKRRILIRPMSANTNAQYNKNIY